MTLNLALRLLRPLQRGSLLLRRCESTTKQSKDDIELSDVGVVAELPEPLVSFKLLKMQNKSRLTSYHRKLINEVHPYTKPKSWVHETVRYKKRVLGRYGLRYLDVTPGVVWPTPEQVADAKEYERVAYPRSLQEEWDAIRTRKEEEAEKIRKREAEMEAKAANSQKWIDDLHRKIRQKEEKLINAKKLRERIILEVKRELNMHSISLGDEKVAALIAKKEKEHRKKLKAEKKTPNKTASERPATTTD